MKPSLHRFTLPLLVASLATAMTGCGQDKQGPRVDTPAATAGAPEAAAQPPAAPASANAPAAPDADTPAPASEPEKPAAFDPSSVVLSAGQRQAAQWALLQQMLKERNPTTLSATAADFAFSPSSMVNALQALWWGTRGDTAVELAKLFRAEPGSAAAPPPGDTGSAPPAALGGAVTLSQASALWMDRTFPVREEYAKLLKSRGLGMAEKVDWSQTAAALEKVNQWGSEVTNGRIPRLFEDGDIHLPVAFVLASVVSFQGAWAETFDPASTRTEDFILLDGSRRPASYLQATRQARTAKFSDAGVSLLELPFSDGRHRMVIALPDKSGAGPLAKLEKRVADDMAGWLKALAPGSVALSVPKFEVGSSADPQATLEALGVRKIFSEKQADFTGASEVAGLKLDTIRHHARVKIDESGAEAVAATAASVAAKSFEPDTMEFRADHPFLFFILGEGGELLFAGRVAQPQAPSGAASTSAESPVTPAGVEIPSVQ